MPAPAKSKRSAPDRASLFAQKLSEELLRERIVPRFVDSYVVEHGRYGLQVHAGLYRDLLTLIQREALLAASAHALQILGNGTITDDMRKLPSMTRKEATAFRQKFLAALARLQQWNAGGALEFQSDLQMYEAILLKAAQQKRRRKPFEAVNHPFVDRCGFLLDSSFLENARVAASRALTDLERLSDRLVKEVFLSAPRKA
ncbi:MAG TPA: hypothetical protein VMJ35_15940 [Dongiaceae bacterium]|nr:hypothetical protein [Dongiaceae bacterium]